MFSTVEPYVVQLENSLSSDEKMRTYFTMLKAEASKYPNIVAVPLGKNNKHGAVTFLDKCVFERLSGQKFYGTLCSGKYYAEIGKGRTKTSLSRLLLGLEKNGSTVADHIDSHPTNNTLRNLRVLTKGQNAQNSSKQKGEYSSDYYGVHFSKYGESYVAKLTLGGKKITKRFKTELEAAENRDIWVVHLGSMAKLNFPERRQEFSLLPRPSGLDQKRKTYGVQKTSNGYQAHVCDGDKRYPIKGSKTSDFKACQRIYDSYIVQNKIGGKNLNFPSEHPEYDYWTNKDDMEHEAYQEGSVKILLKKGGYCLVDSDIFELIRKANVFVGRKYPMLILNGETMLLHRYVMSAKEGMIVDHINCDKRDARRENLRFVTRSQNAANRVKSRSIISTSKYIGIYSKRKKWVARIYCEGELIFLFHHHGESFSARARDLFLLDHPECFQKKNFDDWGDETVVTKWRKIVKEYEDTRQEYFGVIRKKAHKNWGFTIKFLS